MLHNGRRRNANEFCGAYGDSLTFAEMRWLANWLLVRGCNLLIPHAFYYSVRGPRRHERPPDVGMHSPWWDDRFTAFAQGSRRLCWLNTDSEQICEVAILGEQHNLPWRAAKVLFEHQIDFNYLDADDLLHRATISDDGITIGAARYRALILDGDLATDVQPVLDQLGDRVIRWSDDADASLAALRALVTPTLSVTPPASGLRVRHLQKAGFDWYILFNETAAAIDVTVDLAAESARLLDPYTNEMQPFTGRLALAGHEIKVLVM